MAFIDYVDPERTSGRAGELLEESRETYGWYYLYDRLLAHNPAVYEAESEHYGALLDGGRLDPALKELAFVAVSVENECAYCVSTHAELLVEQLGVPRADVEAVATAKDGVLDDQEAAVVDFARQMAIDPVGVTPNHLERLRGVGFDEGDMIELAAVAAEALAANALMDAFGVHPDDLPDGRLDPYRFCEPPV